MPDTSELAIAPLSEPAPEVPQGAAENGAGSPETVASVEAALILRHTHLKEQLPKIETAARDAMHARRAALDELSDIERLLRAHKRIREPRRRKVTA